MSPSAVLETKMIPQAGIRIKLSQIKNFQIDIKSASEVDEAIKNAKVRVAVKSVRTKQYMAAIRVRPFLEMYYCKQLYWHRLSIYLNGWQGYRSKTIRQKRYNNMLFT